MKKRNTVTAVLAACAMLVLILDGKTTVSSAQDGINLCLQTVIPSLFPFFVLSGTITKNMIGIKLRIIRCLGRFLNIPEGTESLLLIGFLSGYPTGAQLVTQAYNDGSLSQSDAQRMLGFCNNAGPAFIFGMLAPLFSKWYIPWILWGIHIIGAIIAGRMLPSGQLHSKIVRKPKAVTNIFRQAISNMATVCAWVILFRIISGFFQKWFYRIIPQSAQVLLTGVLELANGCADMHKIPQEGFRFILAGFMLSFGGLCVMMQTRSVVGSLGFGSYFPGKRMQTLFSTTLCCVFQKVLFPFEQQFHIHNWFVLILLVITIAEMIGWRIYDFRNKTPHSAPMERG